MHTWMSHSHDLKQSTRTLTWRNWSLATSEAAFLMSSTIFAWSVNPFSSGEGSGSGRSVETDVASFLEHFSHFCGRLSLSLRDLTWKLNRSWNYENDASLKQAANNLEVLRFFAPRWYWSHRLETSYKRQTPAQHSSNHGQYLIQCCLPLFKEELGYLTWQSHWLSDQELRKRYYIRTFYNKYSWR